MSEPSPLVIAVAERIVADQTRIRLGRPCAAALPLDGPPVTVLAGVSFPPAVIARRMRFLEAVGWYPAAGAELPHLASLEDRVAVVAASLPETDDGAFAALKAAVSGNDAPPDVFEYWERFFDTVADAVDPNWRTRLAPRPGGFAALEAVTANADMLFGRRRAMTAWPALEWAAKWGAKTKRRWLR